MDHDRQQVGGVPIDWIGIDEAVTRILASARAGSHTEVCTVNLDFLVQAGRDEEVREILNDSALNLADGAPVVWLGRLAGAPATGRLAGSDLVPPLVGAAADAGVPVFFLGGEGGTAAAAATRLTDLYPGLRVGVHEPPRVPLDGMDDEAILAVVAAARPGILFVALGHPKQEKWIHRHRDRLPMVAIGVGCTFDLIAGRRSRAPVWLRRTGLEWAYRVAHEPLRLARRYALDACWLAFVLLPSTAARRLRRRIPARSR